MYYKSAETQIDATDYKTIDALYSEGYLLGRIKPGYLSQTRSLRLDLARFSPSSENRRILRKFEPENVHVSVIHLPLAEEQYTWKIHKTGKDFYSKKFADIKFSASKIKELVTGDFSFNNLFAYIKSEAEYAQKQDRNLLDNSFGYAICYQGEDFLHYCYPFYNLEDDVNNLGMYMMLQAILWAQMHGLKYVYLGGATRPSDKYKLQFSGLEWYDGENWQNDLTQLKSELEKISS